MKGRFSATLLPGMRAANPDLRIGVYRNATFGNAGMTEDLYARRRRQPDPRDQVANHLPDANRLPGWSSTYERLLRRPLIARSRYDDCYLDVLGYGR